MLKEIFDFPLIKKFLQSNPNFKVLFDALHGGTVPFFPFLPFPSVNSSLPFSDVNMFLGGGQSPAPTASASSKPNSVYPPPQPKTATHPPTLAAATPTPI